jgi:predicted enzyme related to lactoylglutathione lyase
MQRRAFLSGSTALSSLISVTALAPLAGSQAADASADQPPGLHPTAGFGEVMALGYYVVFSRPSMMDEMAAFYGRVLALPRMQSLRATPQQPQNKDLFWGGEAVVIDLAHHALELPLDARESHPATARQLPFFRTDDITVLATALAARGAKLLPLQRSALGQELFVIDPMGRLIGFRQPDARSPWPADREGRRRARRGEAFNPGCASMPAHLQELGWVRLTVADPAALVRFYRDVVGLAGLGTAEGSSLFDLGDNTTLEIVAGGMPRPVPAEQRASETVTIVRVASFDATLARLQRAGQPFPFKIYRHANGSFTYIADPEGNLLGLVDRRPPGEYVGQMPVAVEDLEAQRRWVEHTAGQGLS